MKALKTHFSVSPIREVEELLGPDSESEGLVLLLTPTEYTRGSWIHSSLDEEVLRLYSKGIFAGAVGQVEIIPTCGAIPYPYLIVAGIGEGTPRDHYRDVGTFVSRAVKSRKLSSITFALDANPVLPVPLSERIALLAEGVLLGQYAQHSYSKEGSPGGGLAQASFAYVSTPGTEAQSDSVTDGLLRAHAYADGINYARDLTNAPGNLLTPEHLAMEAVHLSQRYGFHCEVLDEREIEERGMSGLYHVGKASIHPPRMIVMKYQGLEEWTDIWGLVGKGITFDTGGISLKEADGMEEMISDMGGAAVLLGFMEALGRLQPQANVVIVIPAAENMPSGGALKPGDVIPTLSGRTVEVLNTDAEGRIVLADGVTYAKQLGAERIIDVATLTGAILTTFGDVATGAVTNNEPFLGELLQAAKNAGEKVWPLPNYPEYREMLKSDVADLKNAVPKRWAGSITGGLFVGEFAEDTPWIHLDTGGTAWLWNERGTDPKGGTGAIVRTLAELICSPAAERV